MRELNHELPATSSRLLPAGEPKLEVCVTADGSATLFVPALNEHYHSQHGARQESAHVFIRHGLGPLLKAAAGAGRPLRILEVGLGTGLNALLTLEAGQAAGVFIDYDGLETFPLPPAVVAALQPEWDQRGTPLRGYLPRCTPRPGTRQWRCCPVLSYESCISRCKKRCCWPATTT